VHRAFGALENMGAPKNLPSTDFQAPAVPQQIPRISGTQDTLHIPHGDLFSINQTPAPISGEQLSFNHPKGDLFQTIPTQAPPQTIGPLNSSPKKSAMQDARERARRIREASGR
jgi:hypothetical protein